MLCIFFYLSNIYYYFFLQIILFLIYLFYLFYFWLHWVFVVAWAFSSCGEQRLLFVMVRGLLIAVASLVAEHGL